MVYREGLERLLEEMKLRRKDLLTELEDLPEGELFSRVQNGRKFFFQRLKKEGNRKKEHRIGITNNDEILQRLVRKRYVEKAISRLNANITAFDNMLKKYLEIDENSVMDDFINRNPELADGVYHGRGASSEWAKSYAGNSDYYSDNLTSIAADGSRRRSKGEVLIGAKLDHHNIPYRYEASAHPDLPYIPDFTIKRPRDEKIIFWEHLGLVNDKEYMESNRTKFAAYEEIGIVPWENLIVTYDQSDGGINEKLIDSMIQGWLL